MTLPISQAVLANNRLYVGGINPIVDGRVPATFDDQVHIVLERVKDTLSYFGWQLDELVFVTAYLQSMQYYRRFNELYESFVTRPYPARKVLTTDFAVKGVLLEMTLIAEQGPKEHYDGRSEPRSAKAPVGG